MITYFLFVQVKGLKKLENFKKKEDELAFWRQHTSPEDVEYFECQLELQHDLMKSYNQVERIIGNWIWLNNFVSFYFRNLVILLLVTLPDADFNVEWFVSPAERKSAEGGHEYFVKWESLPYAEATWEEAGLIKKKWPKKIKQFREREDSKRTPSKLTRALKYRPKFRQVHDQPEYMGGDQVILN